MVPVLGGMRQVARAEWQQDLDSPQTRRRSVRQSVWVTECAELQTAQTSDAEPNSGTRSAPTGR